MPTRSSLHCFAETHVVESQLNVNKFNSSDDRIRSAAYDKLEATERRERRFGTIVIDDRSDDMLTSGYRHRSRARSRRVGR